MAPHLCSFHDSTSVLYHFLGEAEARNVILEETSF